jgi:hypothetical protein
MQHRICVPPRSDFAFSPPAVDHRLAGWLVHDRFRLQVKRRGTLAARSLPLADVPAAKRSNAGLVAASWPMRLETSIN